MREESWYKFLVISTILHFIVLAALSIPVRKSPRKLDLSSSYSVDLVSKIPGAGGGGGEGGQKAKEVSQPAPIPAPKKAAEKSAPVPTVKRQVAAKPKPVPVPPKVAEKQAVPLSKKKVPVKADTDAVSLSKKKVPAKVDTEAVSASKKKAPVQETSARTTPTREELSRLDEKIRDMRKRTRYLDISQGGKGGPGGDGVGSGSGGGGGLPGSGGGGGGRPLDPASQRYMLGVWEKIKNAWSLPGVSSYKKSLETVVTIKIRKDGRIVDINMEKRSGNRAYDESILRVLRAVDPLPPIPASLDTDALEIGFRFLPGDLS